MEIDRDKIGDAILALLYLTLDRDGRASKGFDLRAMNPVIVRPHNGREQVK